MTVSFKSFRADFKGILSNMGRSESFRTTGDCSLHNCNRAED